MVLPVKAGLTTKSCMITLYLFFSPGGWVAWLSASCWPSLWLSFTWACSVVCLAIISVPPQLEEAACPTLEASSSWCECLLYSVTGGRNVRRRVVLSGLGVKAFKGFAGSERLFRWAICKEQNALCPLPSGYPYLKSHSSFRYPKRWSCQAHSSECLQCQLFGGLHCTCHGMLPVVVLYEKRSFKWAVLCGNDYAFLEIHSAVTCNFKESMLVKVNLFLTLSAIGCQTIHKVSTITFLIF